MITDRDIVTQCIATGGDASNIEVEEYAAEEVVTIGADDSIEETLQTMTEHGVRRLPVIDGHELIGIVSQADVAKNLDEVRSDDWSRRSQPRPRTRCTNGLLGPRCYAGDDAAATGVDGADPLKDVELFWVKGLGVDGGPRSRTARASGMRIAKVLPAPN